MDTGHNHFRKQGAVRLGSKNVVQFVKYEYGWKVYNAATLNNENMAMRYMGVIKYDALRESYRFTPRHFVVWVSLDHNTLSQIADFVKKLDGGM